jgi:1-aminocyclopropane-1-carboxylate deaminase/D-cysteine desulfhydrase-like pyridoxal-dependent ACC family enzyme
MKHASMELFENIVSPIQHLRDEVTEKYGVSLAIKREDLIHPEMMGNKLRKLKYNIIQARHDNAPTLLSFGGAYSNHILALSAAGRIFNMPTIGIIRGDELQKSKLNPVLEKAQNNGMQLSFITRADYRKKTEPAFLQNMHDEFGEFTLIPEGGTNALAVKGAAEILDDLDEGYDLITCACGTGGTLAGIIKGVYQNELGNVTVAGFSVLKGGGFISDEIKKLLPVEIYRHVQWDINTDYHFAGYAKTSDALIEFIKWFQDRHSIDLDYIYTGKMMYGLYSLIKSGSIATGSRVLAIHTGGTQTASIRHLD